MDETSPTEAMRKRENALLMEESEPERSLALGNPSSSVCVVSSDGSGRGSSEGGRRFNLAMEE